MSIFVFKTYRSAISILIGFCPVIIVIYGILAIDFYIRYTSAESRLNKETVDGLQPNSRAPFTRDIAIMCLALTLSTSLLLIRYVFGYRTYFLLVINETTLEQYTE